ncbi:MAG: hypothetical protein DMG49_06900 [Acidobacteria bacterium]|nr:MAG: hypothetical protein DMG49_06900 [Acidobacteriota bacterium]
MKVACMDGMVMQHSWLCSRLCDEPGIESLHSIAASGVNMAKQSNALPGEGNRHHRQQYWPDKTHL